MPDVGIRVAYRRAGAAQRAASRRANDAPGLRQADRRLLDAVFAYTTTYSKLTDHVSVTQLAEAAGLSERQVRRSLRRLREVGVIEHVPGRGRGRLTVVGVPEADAKADRPSATFAGGKEAVGKAAFEGGENRPAGASESGQGHAQKEAERARAVLTEKDSKKEYAEESSAAKLDLPEELTRLLRDRFDLRRSQLREVFDAYVEDRNGLARCVWTATTGGNPSALLTVLVREGKHREPGEDTFEQVADLLDIIDQYDSPEPNPVETIDGLTPDEWADYLYENYGDIFERPDEKERP
jgi:DNA-binding transcriptional ArsR family regulator